MQTGHTTRGTRGELVIGRGDPFPPDEDIPRLCRGGVERVTIRESVDLSTADGSHLELVRFLRDCASWGVPVGWRARHDAGYPLRDLRHLQPPVEDVSTRAAWDGGYRFGKLFWRKGPGFAAVKDTRDDERSARFTIDDETTLGVFLACQRPVDVATFATDEERSALDDLLGERLALRIGDRVLSLAVRVRRWPIPYMSI